MNTKQKQHTGIWMTVIVVCVVGMAIGAGTLPGGPSSRDASSAKTLYRPEDIPLPPAPPSETYVKRIVVARFPGVDENAVMEFMDEFFPSEMRRFQKLVTVRPDDATDVLTDLMQEALDLMATRERDTVLFSVRVKEKALGRATRRQAEKARASSGEKRELLLVDLEKTLADAFDVRQELMRKDIVFLEQELDKLKKLVDKRQESKTMVVSRKLETLLDDEGYLEW